MHKIYLILCHLADDFDRFLKGYRWPYFVIFPIPQTRDMYFTLPPFLPRASKVRRKAGFTAVTWEAKRQRRGDGFGLWRGVGG